MRFSHLALNLQRCPRTASGAAEGRLLCWRHGLRRPQNYGHRVAEIPPGVESSRCDCEVCREVRGLGVVVAELAE